ncbi:hypothetical protein NMY22_g18541 [Coprinellus aureogranulatus]|nr:hypothetical protein NMY22_g18541 [Coprinellus aureogranulatus]
MTRKSETNFELRLPAVMQHIPWINPLVTSIPFISSKMRAFSEFGVQQAEKRMGQETKRKDLFYHLYEVPGEKIDRTHEEQMDLMVSNCLLTIVAGSDTTATALSAIFCFLLSERQAYDALKSEIDQAFPAVSMVDGWPEIGSDVLAKLPYLNAVINEALRLVPAVPTHLQRSPEPGSGGKMLGNTEIFIPEGTAVDIPPFALHRDPRYFSPSPDAFIPERWLPSKEGGSVEYVTDKDAFIPFSYGPANCAGKSFALIEMRYVVATLVACFEFQHSGFQGAGKEALEAKMAEWVGGLKDCFVFDKPGLAVDIVSRKAGQVDN